MAYSLCVCFFFFHRRLLFLYEYIAFVCFIHISSFSECILCVFLLHLRGEFCNWYATSNKSAGRLPPLAIIWGDGFRGLSTVCVCEFMLCFLKQRGCETTRWITCPQAAVGKMENELTSILTLSHVPYAEMYSSACFVWVWWVLRVNLTRNIFCLKQNKKKETFFYFDYRKLRINHFLHCTAKTFLHYIAFSWWCC